MLFSFCSNESEFDLDIEAAVSSATLNACHDEKDMRATADPFDLLNLSLCYKVASRSTLLYMIYYYHSPLVCLCYLGTMRGWKGM